MKNQPAQPNTAPPRQKNAGRNRSGLKVRVTMKAFYDRPSEHRLSPGFSAGSIGLNHEETIGCAHAREHALILLRLMDVLAYQCGVDQGEFKDIQGWSRRFTELLGLLDRMSREKGERSPAPARGDDTA